MWTSVGTVISLVVAIAIPFAGSWAKRHLVEAEETQFSSAASVKTSANRGKRWKPQTSMRTSWLVVYAAMGVASWLVWREGGAWRQVEALGRYLCLLLANLLCWPPIFFGGHSRRFAFLDCTVLVLASTMTIPKFYAVNATAGLLLLPYLGWTCFATTLINCSFLSSNPAVVDQAHKMSAIKPVGSNKPAEHPSRTPAKQGAPVAQTQRGQQQKSSGSILHINPPAKLTSDAATSPFQDKAPFPTSPLAQAKDILNKMTDTLAVESESKEAPSNEMLRAGLLRVNSLLSKVSHSIQGAADVLSEGKSSGPLSRMGSLLSRVSMSLHRTPPVEDESAKWPCSDSIPDSYFSCPGAAGYKVRGPGYFSDKKKIGPDACVAKLVSLNLVSVKEPTFHISRFLPSIRDSKAPFIFVWQVMVPGRTHISLTVAWAIDHDPVAALNAAANMIPEDGVPDMQQGFPGDRSHPASLQSTPRHSPGGTDPPGTVRKPSPADSPYAVELSSKSTSALQADRQHSHRRTASTVAPPETLTPVARHASGSGAEFRDAVLSSSSVPAPLGADPFDVSMARFLDENGTEAEVTARRHGMFKIIPRIEKGGWVVKQAVGQNTPVLLGKKLTTKYFRGPKYLEVDVDVGSSRSAASVVGLVQGALKTLVIDIAILLEGKTKEELPESLLGTVRLEHLDLSKAAFLDTATSEIVRKV